MADKAEAIGDGSKVLFEDAEEEELAVEFAESERLSNEPNEVFERED